MGNIKSTTLKGKLVKANQLNRRIPVFAIAKTNRKVSFNRFSRNWKTKKLDIKK
ncbi:50S ribosomal protein L39e [Candidatus Micrarchaeota archaeon]|nr:50S ribosomal protein L39e [Candidatus Micrarchaeota archaeon]